jgi:hypothetical protein
MQNTSAHAIIIGTADIPRHRVQRIDEFVFRCETPIQLARSSSEDRCFKFIRCQVFIEEGIMPKDIICHCTLASTMESQQNYAIAPCNTTFHNRLVFPIYGQDNDTYFDVFFTDAYGLPVKVEGWTLYFNINY